jgi:glutamate/tyrosine decarboxylase-like PLP-dependent enzyme
VDDQGRIRPELLPPFDATTIVVVQAGNVNSGACDPIAAVCERARAAGAWVHVDGAFGLWAAACAEKRALVQRNRNG